MPITNTARRLGLAAILAVSSASAWAQPNEIELPGARAFPESVTSTADGTLYVGSPAVGGVLRVKPGEKPEAWIKPGANGSRSTFGVLADEGSHTLWVCSNDASAMGVSGPTMVKGSFLEGFDLGTGAPKASVRLPGRRAFCNDMAVAPDGSILVTDSLASRILRLKPGAKALDVWVDDPQLAPPSSGVGLDGIVFAADGNLYVDTFSQGDLFRVDVRDGAAGKVTKLATSRPLELTDALRAATGASFLMVEGAGRLDRVTIDGGKATVVTLRDGFAQPTGVTKVGGTAWVSEGQLSHLFDKRSGPPHLPFKLQAVPLAGAR